MKQSGALRGNDRDTTARTQTGVPDFSSSNATSPDEKATPPLATDTTSDIERQISLPVPVNQDPGHAGPFKPYYPEGGRDAWLVVIGAFCALAASLGLYNSTGVFEAYLSREMLRDESPSTVGWLFGVYAFVSWFCGVQVGPTFDAKGPRWLLVAGGVCTVVSVFTMAECKEYYQFMLSFSVLGGLGTSLLITPGMGCIAHWFFERRGLASGIAFIGGGFGGVLFPLVFQALLPRVGWAWSIRVLGFIILALCAVSVVLCKGRVREMRAADSPPPTWRDAIPDPRIFLDGTGAMALSTAGMFLVDLAYLIPMTYVPSYYLVREHLPEDEILSSDASFAFQLLAIINAASCVGRYVAGDLADRFGRYNTMIVSLLLCAVSVNGLFLPDVLIGDLDNVALLVVFCILFGFVSGSNVSLTPICLGQLCETKDYGRYYASCYTVVAIGCLTAIPIAGSLLEVTGSESRQKFWAAVVFTGGCYVAAFACFVWVRIRVKGWNWRTKW